MIDALRARRLELGLTQTDVARHMKVTQHRVSEIESGVSEPKLSTLRRYAEAVDMTINIELRPKEET